MHRRESEIQRLTDLYVLLGHELRSSLNAILLSAEVLALPDIDAPIRQKHIDGVRSGAARAEELLSETDAMIHQPTAPASPLVTLPVLFEAAKRENEARAEAARVTLVFQTHLPDWSVDTAVARLALSNVLVNAIKFADSEKADRWVSVQVAQTEHDADLLVLEVSDNGLGIPACLQPHILKPGFRAHPQIAEGSGLGLTLTRAHLIRRGGSIEFESEEGIGTRVRIKLRRHSA